jgi:hypothetical protein
MLRLSPLIYLFGFIPTVYCQTTIWSEDFSTYIDGTIIGANNNTANSALDWTSGGCISCVPAIGDWWQIESGRMEARDVNDDYCSLTTEVIDISAYPMVYFSVLCEEDGDLEGLYLSSAICADQNNEDYADVEYRINGGAWTLVSNYLGWCGLYGSCGTHTFYGDDGSGGDCRTTDDDWVSSTVQVPGLSGSTLQLRFSATNSSGTEYIQFDNILVVGYDPLPIELIDFKANKIGYKVQLDWATSSERNNEKFMVERSTGVNDWVIVAEMSGAGNSYGTLNYQTFDEKPLHGISYYRLKQVDFDGKSVVFDQKSLEFEISPNPANTTLTIQSDDLQNSELRVFDEFGKLCLIKGAFEDTESTISIDYLQNGVYFLHLVNNEQLTTKKLVVIH